MSSRLPLVGSCFQQSHYYVLRGGGRSSTSPCSWKMYALHVFWKLVSSFVYISAPQPSSCFHIFCIISEGCVSVVIEMVGPCTHNSQYPFSLVLLQCPWCAGKSRFAHDFELLRQKISCASECLYSSVHPCRIKDTVKCLFCVRHHSIPISKHYNLNCETPLPGTSSCVHKYATERASCSIVTRMVQENRTETAMP